MFSEESRDSGESGACSSHPVARILFEDFVLSSILFLETKSFTVSKSMDF